MGRPRKPVKLKILEGDQPCRIKGKEPESPKGIGEPPEWFGELEREAWASVVEKVEPMGILTRADGLAVELYCTSYATWRRVRDRIKAEGLTILQLGNIRVHPLLKVAQEEERFMLRFFGKFGMTPASRASMHVQAEEKPSALMDFLARKPKPGPPEKGRARGDEKGPYKPKVKPVKPPGEPGPA